ncbi:MAG: SsrA-binding protein SmpB [Bacteroidota bacterium]|nr:SsrA-binding protein SmpB [Bacteroidota bacterium]
MANKINIKNKKARHEYNLEEKYDAGIQLGGTEIKSIRAGKASLNDAYCFFQETGRNKDNPELWIRMHIAQYTHGTYDNHEPRRDRKLLLHRRELKKLNRAVKTTSKTIIPTRIYINNRGIAKVIFYLASGKKQYDKREDLKKKDAERAMDQARKYRP